MSASEQAAHRTDVFRVAVFLCCGFGIALQFGRVPASLAEMRGDLGLSLTDAGWIVSTISVIAAIGGLFSGMLAARFGPVNWVLLGLVLSIAGCGAGLVAAGARDLVLGRVVEGAGFIMAATGLPPLIVRAAGPANASAALAIWGVYLPVGMALMLAATPLMLAWAGWRGAVSGNLAMLGLLLGAFVAATRAWRPAGQQASPLSLEENVRGLMADPAALRLAAIFLLYAAQFLAIMSFLPLALREAGGVSPGLVGYAVAAIVLLNGVGNLVGARRIAQGVTPARLLIAGIVMMGGMGALALADVLAWPMRLLAAAVMALCGGLIPATLLGCVARLAVPPPAHSAAVGMLLQGAGIGQLAGPPLFAATASHFGWNGAGGLALALSAAALAIVHSLPGAWNAPKA